MARLYTIKEVSLRTGLSTQLIRKWEERYEAVVPSRFPNGYRGYTPEDIDMLIWLKSRVEQGVPIGLAVKEKDNVSDNSASSERQDNLSLAKGPDRYREKLTECLLNLDDASAQKYFDQLLALHHMDFVLLEVLQPVLVEIGYRWENGDISEFQEHFSCHFIRDRLLAMKNVYLNGMNGPLLVTSCIPGERHELGILFLVYFAVKQGFRVVHLGTSPSRKGILDFLSRHEPTAFAFNASSADTFENAAEYLRELDEAIRDRRYKTQVVVGGAIFQEDGLLEGTTRVHILAGDAHTAIVKIKELVVP